MAISRNIRSIWITDYDKAIGAVVSYLDSGGSYSPNYRSIAERSTITGTKEITVGGYLWGNSISDCKVAGSLAGGRIQLDEDLIAGDTTITTLNNSLFPGTTDDPGYILIEDEIIKYTGTSGDYDLTGCVRGQFDTTDVQHDGTAGTIYVYPWFRGVVQSVDYEPEDEVYAIRVAFPWQIIIYDDQQPLPGYITLLVDYNVYRLEFSKHVVDLVLYDDIENPETIIGTIPGYLPS